MYNEYEDTESESESDDETFEQYEEYFDSSELENQVKQNKNFFPERLKLYFEKISVSDLIHACLLKPVERKGDFDFFPLEPEEEFAILNLIKLIRKEYFMDNDNPKENLLSFLIYIFTSCSKSIVMNSNVPIILPVPCKIT